MHLSFYNFGRHDIFSIKNDIFYIRQKYYPTNTLRITTQGMICSGIKNELFSYECT